MGRDREGRVVIETVVSGAVRYTLDGTEPTRNSPRYREPITHREPVTVCARMVGDGGELGPIAEVSLDLAKTLWSIRSVSSEQAPSEPAAHVIDGDPTTIWHTRYGKSTPRPPHQITIDLGEERTIRGFVYLPRAAGTNGTVERYRIATSRDGQRFDEVHSGSFGNIARSPVEQRILFESPVRVRYLRFGALSAVNDNPWASAAEIGVIADPQPPE